MTNTTNNNDAQAVSVLGLPDLARVLEASGIHVVTGATFRAAAAATNQFLKVAPLALIFADAAEVGTQPWVDKVVRSCPAVFVGVDLPAGAGRIAGNTGHLPRLGCPVSVDEILAAVGMAPACPGALLLGDGSVVASAAPAPVFVAPAAPVYEPEPVFVAPAAPVFVAPVAPAPVQPAYQPPAQLVEVDDADSWGLDEPGFIPAVHQPAPAPAMHQVPAAQHAPVDFWRKAPAKAHYQQPAAPVAPVVYPPVAQAPAAPQYAPVPPAPVAYQPQPQPVQYAEPQYAPAPVQYAPPAAPVFVAPAAPAYVPPPQPQYVAPVPAPQYVPAPPPAELAEQIGQYEPPPTPQFAPAQPVAYTSPVVPQQPALVVGEQVGVETTYSAELGRNLAPVVFTAAGKGGVGKTSIALALAQRAAVVGGVRTVLIDANRGQGDLRIYLGLNKAGLPTVYDALMSGDPASAIISAERLNANRTAGGEQLGIALVQAPPPGLADPASITAALYYDVITAARGMSDLVVIDTQIVEGSERGLFDDLIIPMLAAHAFGLGITDLSRPGVDNLGTHLREFIERGVPVARLMTLMNRAPVTTEFDLQQTSDALSRYGIFLGCIPADADLHKAMAYGTSIQDNPVLAPILDQVLMRVTGNPVFAQQQHAGLSAEKKRGGFFRRRRG